MVKIEVSTHTGDVDLLDVEDYDAGEVVNKLNDTETQAIKLADNIYSKIDIKNIRVIESAE